MLYCEIVGAEMKNNMERTSCRNRHIQDRKHKTHENNHVNTRTLSRWLFEPRQLTLGFFQICKICMISGRGPASLFSLFLIWSYIFQNTTLWYQLQCRILVSEHCNIQSVLKSCLENRFEMNLQPAANSQPSCRQKARRASVSLTHFKKVDLFKNHMQKCRKT